MTAKEIYENALALNISRIDEEYDLSYFAVKLVNILLAEVFLNNNQIRQKKGLKLLEKPVVIKSIDDTIAYESELYAPMCYALAAKLLQAQEEYNLAAVYNNQYVILLELVTPAVRMEVE
ncbi:MAG: hypothetical protein J6C76_05795 [Oscillospiraceae bacterium]|nr:hypothetical protein [Oscillospiraceae bacterium]